MGAYDFDYVIVGSGLAGANAVEGIREVDRGGRILLWGREPHLPYDRPPLSKKLWTGAQKVPDIFLHDEGWYAANGTTLLAGESVGRVDPQARCALDADGHCYRYGKLLLATGGTPRRLPVPGGSLAGVEYFRTLDDYERVRALARPGDTAVVVGGGFIGSEMAAALAVAGMHVVLVFPEQHVLPRIVPRALGLSLLRMYRERGVEVLAGDEVAAFDKHFDRCRVRTRGGREFDASVAVVGVGIEPDVRLAREAGLATGDGIVVDSRLRTSRPEIFAAGDAAFFPYAALERGVRVEHQDNAIAQGRQAGRNMAGADEPYDHMPMFYSDLFDFGFEAVGDLDNRLETVASWQEENRTGVVYYLAEGRVRGVLLCNTWDRVEAARELIRRGAKASREELARAIR